MDEKLRIFIETHGCELNKAESSSISLLLQKSGYIIANSPEKSDVIIINSCSVRESAETKVFGQLGIYKSLQKQNGVKLILTGCMAEHDTDILSKRFPYIDYIIPNVSKSRIIPIIDSISNGKVFDKAEFDLQYKFFRVHYDPNQVENYVPIQHGCNNFCSYCIVPYTRGREISRDAKDIINELCELDRNGVKVVTLLGQNVNSYKFDTKSFQDLIKEIEKQNFENIIWMNFESPHPKDFTDTLIDILADSRYFVHHYHIPIQSANDRILSLMNRHYTKKDIYTLFEKIRKKIPDATLVSDIMLGFPTETEEEAQETIDAVKDIRFLDNFMYFYNPRPQTFAYKNYTDLPICIKKNRLSRLIDIQRKITLEEKQKRIGTTIPVIVKSESKDGNSLAVSSSRESVIIKRSEFNTLHNVKIESIKGNTLVAEL